MPDAPSNPFGLTLPLRIVQLEEAVKVMDAGADGCAFWTRIGGEDG